MLKNRIIHCLDVKNGRVVKGINFVHVVDAGEPVEEVTVAEEPVVYTHLMWPTKRIV